VCVPAHVPFCTVLSGHVLVLKLKGDALLELFLCSKVPPVHAWYAYKCCVVDASFWHECVNKKWLCVRVSGRMRMRKW